MTNDELIKRLRTLTYRERRITSEIVELINTSEICGLPFELGYSSTIEWLIKDFSYSESAAYRRVTAARVLRDVPEAQDKLADGSLSLTNLARAYSLMRKHEHAVSEKLKPEAKQEVLRQIENLTTQQAQRTLFGLLPGAAEAISTDSLRQLNKDLARLNVTIDMDTSEKLEIARARIQRYNPGCSWGTVISHIVTDYTVRKDPARKVAPRATAENKPRVAKARRRGRLHLAARSRREVWERADHRCEFINKKTGRRCEEKRRLDVDHIIPIAHGGTNHIDNLRLLCVTHNQHCADLILGKNFMKKHRTRKAKSKPSLPLKN